MRQDGDKIVMCSRRGAQPVQVPDAIIAHPILTASAHPDYAAAKAGDARAALRLAQALLTPEVIGRLRDAIGDSTPTLLPVLAPEMAGNNAIPLAVARVLEEHLGLDVATGVLQSRKVGRTAMDGLDRILVQPEFDGPIGAADYLLIDDTLTQGGTFAALASHVTAFGGRVTGAFALTGKQYSRTLLLSKYTLAKVRSLHGQVEGAFRRAVGYGFDALTESEGRYLGSFRPAERARDRIAAAGLQGEGRSDQGGTGPGEAGQDRISRKARP